MAETATAAAAPERTRLLIPHEHGAYGQLILPLLTGLALGRATLAALLLVYCIVVAFVAHESLLVVLGQRGRRSTAGDGPTARRVLAILGAQAVLTGVAGFALAPPLARWALLAPVVLVLAVAAFLVTRSEKTIAGEVTVGAALSSGGLAVALAAGAPLDDALAAWVAWVLSFAAATLAVQVILERARSKGARDPGPLHAGGIALLVAGAFAAVPLLGLQRAAPLALLPTAALSLACCFFRFSPKKLRTLGFAMVGSSVAAAVILVAGLR